MRWTPAEIAHKLTQVAALPPDELRGWWNLLSGHHHTARIIAALEA